MGSCGDCNNTSSRECLWPTSSLGHGHRDKEKEEIRRDSLPYLCPVASKLTACMKDSIIAWEEYLASEKTKGQKRKRRSKFECHVCTEEHMCTEGHPKTAIVKTCETARVAGSDYPGVPAAIAGST